MNLRWPQQGQENITILSILDSGVVIIISFCLFAVSIQYTSSLVSFRNQNKNSALIYRMNRIVFLIDRRSIKSLVVERIVELLTNRQLLKNQALTFGYKYR